MHSQFSLIIHQLLASLYSSLPLFSLNQYKRIWSFCNCFVIHGSVYYYHIDLINEGGKERIR